jgi:hypothetical protein
MTAGAAAGIMRVAIAVTPLLLAPVFVYLVGEGVLDLGGGEMDLVWVAPWLLWSLLFAVASLVFWRRGWPVTRATAWSAGVGLAGLCAAALILAALGRLGVAGRF